MPSQQLKSNDGVPLNLAPLHTLRSIDSIITWIKDTWKPVTPARQQFLTLMDKLKVRVRAEDPKAHWWLGDAYWEQVGEKGYSFGFSNSREGQSMYFEWFIRFNSSGKIKAIDTVNEQWHHPQDPEAAAP